jgi:Protein of unknown function (DUF935)
MAPRKTSKARLREQTGQNPDTGAFSPYRTLAPADIRRRNRGALTRQPTTTPEWYAEDVTDAIRLAACGDLSRAVQLMRAAHSDGTYSGVLESFTAGITRLPRRFSSSDPEIVAARSVGHATDEPGSARSLFDDSAPTSEIAALLRDGREFGVWLAELVWLEDVPAPLLVRLDPEFLRFDRFNNLWVYRTIGGDVQVVPGNGTWFFGCPGGRTSPWEGGIFGPIGRAWAEKYETQLALATWCRKLAGAARVGYTPVGSTRTDGDDLLQGLIDFHGQNSSFVLPSGFEIKLLESNGVGAEVFAKSLARCDESILLTVASQSVTTQGGEGFSNSAVQAGVRSDVLARYAQSFDNDLNAQYMPYLVAAVFGEDAYASVETITAPIKDLNQEAQSLEGAAAVITQIAGAITAAKAAGLAVDNVDLREIMRRFDVPITKALPKAKPTLVLLPGGAADPAHAADPTAPPTKEEADTALNGAQVESLVDIVTAVATGQIPRDAALAIIKRAFNVDDAEAGAMLGSAGAGFTPAADPKAAAI